MHTEFSTPQELELSLGEQLRAERLRKNISLEDLSSMAGVSKGTLRSLESGSGGRVESLLRVVKALGRGDWIASFAPPVRISPMQIAKGVKHRQRASRSHIPMKGMTPHTVLKMSKESAV